MKNPRAIAGAGAVRNESQEFSLTATRGQQQAIAIAKRVRIEHELFRRGIKLRVSGSCRVGRCPRCGSDFWTDLRRNVFACRSVAGDVIVMAAHFDDCTFVDAVARLVRTGAGK